MYRILLVDDEILVRDAIRENIDWNSMDCELVGDCENGRQAVEFVKKQAVDIVLTDICMPYMDGMELCHFLHDNFPDIVIVIFSGFGEFEYAKKAIQYNVSEYMLKPVTAMELKAVIQKMKEKVDQRQAEKRKMESLTKTLEDYRKNAQVIRSKAIEALVNCTRDVKKSLSELSQMGICLEAAGYRVAVFDMDLYCGMYQLNMEKRQESALMSFVLFNVTDEIVTREGVGIAYQEGNSRVSVLFMGGHTREFFGKLNDICREIQEKVYEVIGIEVSMGIGGWVRLPSQLILSHNQAEKALGYRYLLGGCLIMDMEEERTDKDIYLEENLESLKSFIKSGNRKGMEDTLTYMEDKIKSALVEKSRACVYLQQIIRAVGNACENMEVDTRRIFRTQEELLKKVTEASAFSAAADEVREYAAQAFEKLLELNSSSGKRQAALAMDYIRRNYMQSDLSLNDVCSYLNISTSYFSTIFKEETGETFTEVLIRTRMEKAKELLRDTTLKNYEIAEKVGFSDPHYFGISFKKMTGKTPTEYAREKRR